MLTDFGIAKILQTDETAELTGTGIGIGTPEYMAPEQAQGKIISSGKTFTEPKTEIQLLIAITQREKFEFILQKCTEVGVHSFIPVITERSLVQFTQFAEKKSDRWKRIVMEASEQSHRTHVPEVHPVSTFQRCMNLPVDQKIIAYESEQKNSFKNIFSEPNISRIALIIGPEGGFTEYEIDLARKSGWKSVTLGPRILRMETAAIVACTLILDYAGDLGS